MTLATIATKALRGISGIAIPSTFYASTDDTAVTCVALANEAGQDLEKIYRWQDLIKEHTFSTVAGTATYALPTAASTGGAFRAFANMTQWDRTNQWRLTGPIPPAIYQWLKSGITVFAGIKKFFILRGSLFTIYPTPTAIETIAYDYYSKAWITKQTDSSNIAEWSADGDTSQLDEDLIAADLKWRFLQAKGFPFEVEYKRYESLVEAAQADNGGRTIINLNSPVRLSEYPGNLPETNVGS